MSCNDIYIYGPIGTPSEDNPDCICAQDVTRQLGWCEDGDITVHVNCPGGSYFEGLAIFNAFNSCDKKVIMVIDGIAASMASIFILAGDEIVMSPFARIMTHCMKGESKGNATQLRDDAAQMELFEGSMLDIYSRRTGLTPEECRAKFMNENDTWFSAEEAVAAKLADRIQEGKLMSGVAETHGRASLQDVNAFYQSCAAILRVPNQSKDMDFLKLKVQLQLGEETTEEAFTAQVADWRTKAAETEQLTAQLAGYKEAAALAETNRINGLIEKAVSEKRITASQKETWLQLFALNADHALKALMSIAPAKDLSAVGTGGDNDERAQLSKMSFDELDRGNKLAKVRADYWDIYKAKFVEKFGKEPVANK